MELALTARQGTGSGHRSLLGEFSVPFRSWEGIPVLEWFKNLPGLFYVRAFQGDGETPLEYNMKGDDRLRIGFAAARDNRAEPESR